MMLGARAAVQAHCTRLDIAAEVRISELGSTLHLRRRIDASTKVGLIIPTRGSSGTVWGQERVFIIELVQSIITKSTWKNVEFVIVADTDTPAIVRRALTQLCGDRLVWVDYDKPFNFSDKIGQGRAASSGDVLLLLNDDMEVISEDFIEELVGLALDPGVGAVGARLLLADGRLQHIGHRYADGTFHLFAGYDGDYPGPEDMCRVTRECIGVTAACLAIRADVFDEVGGMALDFPNNFNDVDFALRLRERGLRNIVTPHAVLFHFESVSRDGTVTAEEAHLLFSRWGAQLNSDPYSNPNLESGRIEWLEKGGH
jgi:glycosyltransferase involved in cell wall biosynthesis